MNKFIFLSTIMAIVISFSSCNREMTPLQANYFKTQPNPLEVKGGVIDAHISGTFPTKYFHKRAVMTITPVLKYRQQEKWENPTLFQGEKVLDNHQTVNYQSGENYTIAAKFDFEPNMANAALFLHFDIKQKNKTYQLPPIKVADGVITTSLLYSTSMQELPPAVAPNYFQRITQENEEADILFLIQQAQLRKSELHKENVIAFGDKIKAAKNAQNKHISDLQVLGYASPDGDYKLNKNLAKKRQKVTTEYINKELQKIRANVTVDSKFTAEDWEGFQRLMENSDIQDKELIIRVLSMYQDPEQREREIKNLSETFKEIADEILPQLRRSRLKMIVDVMGKSDYEIRRAAVDNAHLLTAEELLYAGTLMQSDKFKGEIYEKFIDRFPADERGYINLGLVRYDRNELKDAENLFKKALSIQPNNPDANFNMGLINLKKGAFQTAETYFGKAGESTGDLNRALGTTYLAQGDYDKAAQLLQHIASNNTALAQILSKNYNEARKTLQKITHPNSTTTYLTAIVAARTNDRETLYKSTKEIVKKDHILTRKMKTDIEFAPYRKDPKFSNILK